jgi:chemotaxis regulatin CheY-phosphate phosphatase CheZ
MEVIKIEKSILYILFILTASIILGGCSIEYNINTDSVKDFKKDLMEVSDTIKSVKVTFVRPQVTYTVNMTEEPTQEVLDAILEKAKSFTTVENMEKIARKVRWNLRVSKVHLRINTDGDRDIEHEYYTWYYRTADATDTSPENIDAYQTWYKECE